MTAWATARALFIVLAVTYVLAGTWTARRVSATGDEVGYLMAADAVLHGEGFELTERWRAIDHASYSPGDPIPPEEFARTTAPSLARPGRYPLHDLALSLLAIPALAIGGRALVVAAVGLAMAAALAFAFRGADALGLPRGLALVGTAIAALSVPALTYSGQVFPDAVAPLPVAVTLLALGGAAPASVAGWAIASLPLLHVRYWPLAVGLALALLVGRRWRGRDGAALLGPVVTAVGGLALLDLAVYGVALPHAGWLLFFGEPHAPIETYAGAAGIAGLFVDRAFGLVPAAPIAALLFLGAGAGCRRPAERSMLLAALPYVVLVPFVDWTGGFSPQARYLAPLVPIMAVLYARALTAGAPARLAALGLGLWTAAQSAVYAVAPWLRYDAFGVEPLADDAWRRLGLPAPSGAFPLFGTEAAPLLAVAWCLGLAALLAVGALLGSAEASPKLKAG